METMVIVFGSILIGLVSGILFTWKLVFPSFYHSLHESAEDVYELYKNKRENCPTYLVERAKSISAEKSPNDAESDKKEVVSEDKHAQPIDACKILYDRKCESDKSEKCVSDNRCCCCDHTLVKCCEVDKGEIIEVINKVITGKQHD